MGDMVAVLITLCYDFIIVNEKSKNVLEGGHVRLGAQGTCYRDCGGTEPLRCEDHCNK